MMAPEGEFLFISRVYFSPGEIEEKFYENRLELEADLRFVTSVEIRDISFVANVNSALPFRGAWAFSVV